MALVGSIAIEMSVRTANMQKGLKAAQKSVSAFGVKATAALSGFDAKIGGVGKAVVGVVNDFYIRPLARGARAIGRFGRSIGDSVHAGLSPVRAFGSVVADTGKAIGGVVNDFYLRPFAKLARVAGGVGGKLMSPFAGKGKLAAGGLLQMGENMAGMAMTTAKFGRAIAGIGLKGAAAGFTMMGSAVRGTVGALREGVNALGAFAIKGGAIAAFGLYKVAKAASSLTEQMNRAKILFGQDSAYIIDQAKLMGDAFGVSRSMFISTASELGGMFKGAGYSARDAAQLGVAFTKLAKDVGSATQMSDEEVFTRMASGIAGEAEAVRRWGVDLTEANLKVKATAMNMKIMGGELSQQQKTQVRVAILTEKLAYAQGDLARTADEAENATKGLVGRFENLMETVGKALLPIVGSAMSQLQVGVEALSMTWKSMTAGIVSDQVGVVGAVGETANSMGWLQKSVGFVADAFQVLKIGFYGVQSFITAGIAKIVGALASMAGALDSMMQSFGMAGTGIGDLLSNVAGDLGKLSESQFAQMQSQLAAPAASEGVNAAFKAAQGRISAMRAEAMKPGVDISKLKPAGEVAKKPGETKFASASAFGSQEAANAVLRSRYGASAGGKGPEDVTAKNTGRMVTLLEQAVGAGRRVGADVGGAGNIGEVLGAIWKNF